MEFKMKPDVGFFTETGFGRLDVAGDDQYGFRPYQLLVSSVAVCSGGVLRKVLEKMRMDIQDIHIQADAERVEEEANRVSKITVHFRIAGNDLDEKKIEKAMALTRKNCSMVQSVLGSIEIEETFEIVL
ncbi:MULTISPECIES: OsmC family protein [unclassified Bacillus (in: firmicutes)]|uniref:OsmC family protein n=1 Tax=unclassified Bacillus (in: firmicutes) TaxID=185979 RepID=UPI001BECF44A|nr:MULTISPECIES: OsmC family protein [unclassified Bacillus (in: firmicutes)]MBT2637691.1 OsmC family protein [Bacillus sp. ISL-39]MBT2662013.1 OsmC family protein [Bacillus sp. ISL-45]